MNIEEKIDKLLLEIPKITRFLYMGEQIEAYQKFIKIMGVLNEVMITFIEAIPVINELGVDIPKDVILMQLDNLTTAYERQDNVILADTLEYEIMESISLYKEILEQI